MTTARVAVSLAVSLAARRARPRPALARPGRPRRRPCRRSRAARPATVPRRGHAGRRGDGAGAAARAARRRGRRERDRRGDVAARHPGPLGGDRGRGRAALRGGLRPRRRRERGRSGRRHRLPPRLGVQADDGGRRAAPRPEGPARPRPARLELLQRLSRRSRGRSRHASCSATRAACAPTGRASSRRFATTRPSSEGLALFKDDPLAFEPGTSGALQHLRLQPARLRRRGRRRPALRGGAAGGGLRSRGHDEHAAGRRPRAHPPPGERLRPHGDWRAAELGARRHQLQGARRRPLRHRARRGPLRPGARLRQAARAARRSSRCSRPRRPAPGG